MVLKLIFKKNVQKAYLFNAFCADISNKLKRNYFCVVKDSFLKFYSHNATKVIINFLKKKIKIKINS